MTRRNTLNELVVPRRMGDMLESVQSVRARVSTCELLGVHANAALEWLAALALTSPRAMTPTAILPFMLQAVMG